MSGVEILNQTEIITHQYGCGLRVGLIILVLLTIVGVIVCIKDDDVLWLKIGVLSGLFLGFILGGVIESKTDKDIHTGTYTYQVTISNEVKMTDFLNKYEIIKQEGKIYTVELRNKEKD